MGLRWCRARLDRKVPEEAVAEVAGRRSRRIDLQEAPLQWLCRLREGLPPEK